MLKTESYAGGIKEVVKAGEIYYFGQLWSGNGNGTELLESGAIAMVDEGGKEIIVRFAVIEMDENILNAIVRVTEI